MGPLAPPESADPTAFPRIWMYYGTPGSGSPLLVSNGVFDSTTVSALSKWDWVTINSHPFADVDHPENAGVVAAIKAQNSHAIVVWYQLLTNVFDFSGSSNMWGEMSTLTTPYKLYRNDYPVGTVLYPDGPATTTAYFWDIAQAPSSVVTLNHKYLLSSDGVFWDYLIGKPANWNSAIIDYGLAGYGSVSAMNTATAAAMDTIVADYQATAKLQYGNRGGTAFYCDDSTTFRMNGELFESWDANLTSDFDSWMTTAGQWRGPSATGGGTAMLKAEIGGPFGGTGFDSTYVRRVRFTLGSACVLGGRAYIGYNRSTYGDDLTLWADEYTVTAAGVTDTNKNVANKGWLGMPTEFGAKDAGSSLYIRRFDRGIVLVNGTSSSHSYNLGATYRRILGAYDTAVNDGSTVTSVTVPSRDARFLLRV